MANLIVPPPSQCVKQGQLGTISRGCCEGRQHSNRAQPSLSTVQRVWAYVSPSPLMGKGQLTEKQISYPKRVGTQITE